MKKSCTRAQAVRATFLKEYSDHFYMPASKFSLACVEVRVAEYEGEASGGIALVRRDGLFTKSHGPVWTRGRQALGQRVSSP